MKRHRMFVGQMAVLVGHLLAQGVAPAAAARAEVMLQICCATVDAADRPTYSLRTGSRCATLNVSWPMWELLASVPS